MVEEKRDGEIQLNCTNMEADYKKTTKDIYIYELRNQENRKKKKKLY